MSDVSKDVVANSMMTLSKLPDDLLEEILSRIPATTLKRLKTSCKRWNGLFNDKGFGRKQFDKAEKQFLYLMLMRSYELALIKVRLDGGYGPYVLFGADELRLVDPNISSASSSQFHITDVIHCDGLLFVQSKTRVAVWNPLTGGQSRWIEKANCRHHNFCFGYYESKNGSCRDKSYKILNYGKSKDSSIYELDSDSWRVIDDVVPGSYDEDHCLIVCLKGDSYWFGRDGLDTLNSIITLHKFDFSSEKFGCVPLPYHRTYYDTFSITVVREEKLAVLLQKEDDSKTEVWLSNRIDETKVVSWSFMLALDLSDVIENGISSYASFLFDEEKKDIVCCDRLLRRVRNDVPEYRDIIYIIDENSKVTKSVGEDTSGCMPSVLNYVPSLVQIDQAQGSKRKRGIDQARGSKKKRRG